MRRYARRVGRGIFCAALVAAPISAYWIESNPSHPYSAAVALVMLLFYVLTALVLDSQMILGALFGAFIGALTGAGPTNQRREGELLNYLVLMVIFASIGAALGGLYESGSRPQPKHDTDRETPRNSLRGDGDGDGDEQQMQTGG